MPPFGVLDFESFQELSNELMLMDDGVMTSDVYGKQGQSQRGIDILAHLEDGVTVAQCKRYQTITDADIRKASDEFLKHLAYWKEHGVRKFVFITSADTTDRKVQDQILKEKQRFKALGIRYESWPPRKLVSFLKDRRDLMERYFRHDWAEHICGTDVVASTRSIQYLAVQLTDTATILEQDAKDDFESARAALRMGQYSEAFTRIQRLKAPARFSQLTAQTRAKIHILKARYDMAIDELDSAQTEINMAKALGAMDTAAQRVEAILELARGVAVDEVLSSMPSDGDSDLIDFKISLLYQYGKIDEAETIVQKELELRESSELLRIQALVKLSKFDIASATAAILRAAELPGGNSEGVRLARATIHYWSAVALSIVRPSEVLWPLPMQRIFIKEDQASLSRLRQAASDFADIASTRPRKDPIVPEFHLWELACLATVTDRTPEEETRIATLADLLKTRASALPWLLSGLVPCDRAALREHLEARIKADDCEVAEINALVALVQSDDNDHPRALGLLEQYRDRYIRAGQFEPYVLSRIRSLIATERIIDAEELAVQVTTPLTRFFAEKMIIDHRAQAAGDASEVIAFLSSIDTDELLLKTEVLEALLELRDYAGAAALGVDLAPHVQTAAFMALVAHAQYNAAHDSAAVATVNMAEPLYAAGLPQRLKLIRASARYRLGDALEAIEELEEAAGFDLQSETVDVLLRAYSMIGDFRKLSLLARRLLTQESPDPRQLIALAQLFADRDSVLFDDLLNEALKRDIPEDVVGTAYLLCVSADHDIGAKTLLPRVMAQQTGPNPVLIPVPVETAPTKLMESRLQGEQLLQQYSEAKLTIHTVAEFSSLLLPQLLFDVPTSNRQRQSNRAPVFADYGARPLAVSIKHLYTATTVYLDVTTLALAWQCQVIDDLLRLGKRFVMSRDIIPVLINCNLTISSPQPKHLGALRMALELPVQEQGVEYIAIGADGINMKIFAASCHAAHFLTENQWNDVRGVMVIDESLATGAREHVIKRGSRLLLDYKSAYLLSYANVLTTIRTAYDVTITADASAHLRQELHNLERFSRFKSFLRSFVEALNARILKKQLLLTPQRASGQAVSAFNAYSPMTILADLLTVRPSVPSSAVVAIDDRATNRFTNTDSGLFIVTLAEILPALRSLRIVDDDRYFALITSIRETFVCFLPVTSDEIITALDACTLGSDASLVESRHLAAVRTYLERMFELRPQAAIGPQSLNGPDESFCFESSLAAMREAIARLKISSDLVATEKIKWLDGLYKGCILRYESHK